MDRVRRGRLLVAVGLCVAAAASVRAEERASPASQAGQADAAIVPPLSARQVRDRWYIGFGLGYGNGRAEFASGSAGFDELFASDADHLAFEIELGLTLTPRLLAGIQTGFVSVTSSTMFGGVRVFQTNHYDAAFVWFPRERGLLVRGGAGYSTAELGAKGVNVLGGVGYAFWLGRRSNFNLSLNLQGVRHWYVIGRSELEASTEYAMYVGLSWY